MNRLVALILSLIAFSVLNAQSQEGEDYIKAYYKNYYSYGIHGMKAMEFKISSPEIIAYLNENGIQEQHYLFQVLITHTGELYFKSLLDSVSFPQQVEANLQKHFNVVAKQFRGVFAEFNLFIMNTPFWDIPQEYTFYHDQKFDVFKFKSVENGSEVQISKYFNNMSGMIERQIYASRDVEIKIYPQFKTISNRWQCTGWDTQIFQNGKLTSGTGIRFDYTLGPRDLWLPSVIKMMTQTPEAPDKPVWVELYLHDFHFDFYETPQKSE